MGESHEVRLSQAIKVLKYMVMVVSDETINPLQEDNTYSQLVSLLETLLHPPSRGKAVMYFVRHEAATAFTLRRKLNLPKPTVYRILDDLQRLGFIRPCTVIRDDRRRRVTVYSIPTPDPDKVQKAIILHKRLQSRKYLAAEKLAQTLLETYIPRMPRPEITVREIWMKVRELRIPYANPDIVDMATQILQEQGVKVWR